MTTAPIANNPYGYHGHLTSDVLLTFIKYWPIVGGGMAEGNPWNLTRNTFDETIVESLGGKAELRTASDPYFSKYELTEEKKAEVLQYWQKNYEALLADQKIMIDAGYMPDGKLDADKLWADLTIARIVTTRGMMGNDTPQIPMEQYWYFEDANRIARREFDEAGFFIPGQTKANHDNAFGYEGHLSEAVLEILERYWKWAGGHADGPIPMSNTDLKSVLERIAAPYNSDQVNLPEIQKEEIRKTIDAEQTVMKKAGYLLFDGRVNKYKAIERILWDDLVLAGLSFADGDKTMLASPAEWWWGGEERREHFFDADGYFIPGSVILDRNGHDIDIDRLSYIDPAEKVIGSKALRNTVPLPEDAANLTPPGPKL